MRSHTPALYTATTVFAMSQLGDLLLVFSLALRSAEHGRPALTVAVFAAELVPAIVFGSLIGQQLDKRDVRAVMLSSLVFEVLVICIIGTVDNLATQIGLLGVLSTAGLATVTGAQVIVARLGDVGGRQRADSTASLAASAAASLAPAIGGWLYLEQGVRGVCIVDATTFVVMAAVVGSVLSPWAHVIPETGDAPAVRGTASLRGRWSLATRDGIRFFFRSASLRLAMPLILTVVFATCLEGVAGVYYLRQIVGGDAREYGLVLAAWAVGAGVGSVLSAERLRIPEASTVLIIGGAMIGLGLGCAGIVPRAWVVSIAFFIGGLGNGMFNTAVRTVINVHARERRGLAWGTFRTLSSVVIGLGLVLGAPGVLFRPRECVIVASALTIVAVAAFAGASRSARAAELIA